MTDSLYRELESGKEKGRAKLFWAGSNWKMRSSWRWTKCSPFPSGPSAFWGNIKRGQANFFSVLAFTGFGNWSASLNYKYVVSEGTKSRIGPCCAPLGKAQQKLHPGKNTDLIPLRSKSFLNIQHENHLYNFCIGILVFQLVILILQDKYPSQETTRWKRRHKSLNIHSQKATRPYHVTF